jgi:hypothetical protein
VKVYFADEKTTPSGCVDIKSLGHKNDIIQACFMIERSRAQKA